jgi:Flp pilus assembly pilin Flp
MPAHGFALQKQALHPKEIEQKYSMIQALKNFLTDEGGQDLVEYSLMLVLIGTVVLIYLTGLGLNLATLLQKIGAKLELFANSMS